jgi:predicted nucleic acid-binding protein
VSKLIIFDASIFIDHLRTVRHQERIESVTGLIRTSSVVLTELWRGAAKPAERKFLVRPVPRRPRSIYPIHLAGLRHGLDQEGSVHLRYG